MNSQSIAERSGSSRNSLHVEWLSGSDRLSNINQQLYRAGDNQQRLVLLELLFKSYLKGHQDGNETYWREHFGNPQSLLRVTDMALAHVTLPGKPHHLTVWGMNGGPEPIPVVRVDCQDYEELCRLRDALACSASVTGYSATVPRRDFRGWVTTFEQPVVA